MTKQKAAAGMGWISVLSAAAALVGCLRSFGSVYFAQDGIHPRILLMIGVGIVLQILHLTAGPGVFGKADDLVSSFLSVFYLGGILLLVAARSPETASVLAGTSEAASPGDLTGPLAAMVLLLVSAALSLAAAFLGSRN